MKKNEIKIVKEIVVYENKYGRLFDDEVVFLPQEKPGNYVRWKWNTNYSVGILPVTTENEIILIEGFRHAARKPVIEIPKGFGEDNIDPLDIAKKELAEETGYISNQWESIGEILTDTSFTFHPMKLFIAWNCTDAKLTKHEDSEVIIQIHKYAFESIPELVNRLNIYDVVSLFAMLSAYRRR